VAGQGQAPFQLALVIRKFDADMIVGRTARIDMTMNVVDQAGRSVFDLLERLRDNGSLTSDQFEVERAKIILAPPAK
jgi:hypothetical protein